MSTQDLGIPFGGADHPGSPHKHGITVVTTAVIAVGEMAGAGVLALPFSMIGTGYIGILLNIVCGLVSAYTGALLGRCWMMVLDRHDEHRDNCRFPYPTIGQVAYGKFGRLLVSCCINITMLATAVVFLLLASDNVQSLVSAAGKDISFCFWLIIVVGALTPFALLGTPGDFWFVGVAAVAATSVACVVILANIITDHAHTTIPVYYPTLTFTDFFVAFGTICFAYNGHPGFPTFQADMKEPEKFGRAISLAYFIILLMYLPVAIAGYTVYGGNADSNILNTLSPGPMLYTVQILITCHLFCSFIIVINPVSQEMEELFSIPKQFNFKRVFVRVMIIIVILFVAESIPHFGPILSLIGGSTMTLLAFIFPPLFYLKLSSMEGTWKKENVPLHTKVLCGEIMGMGLTAGVAASYSAIQAIATFASTPCYLEADAGS